jgi:hypothetical protein
MNSSTNDTYNVFVNQTMGYDTQKELQRAALTTITSQYEIRGTSCYAHLTRHNPKKQ